MFAGCAIPWVHESCACALPNPFGATPVADEAVVALQRKYGFSSDYASFLRTPNGFSPHALEDSGQRERYVVADARGEEGPDLALLFSADVLAKEAPRVGALGGYFFPIGKGYGGDHYAEVLCGKHRVSIVSLNHEAYLGVSSLENFVEQYDGFADFDVDFDELDDDQRADFLVETEGLDLVWKIAPSLSALLHHGVCITDDGTGVTVPGGVEPHGEPSP